MDKPILVARELDGASCEHARAVGACESNRLFEVRRLDVVPSAIVFHALKASCIADAENIAMDTLLKTKLTGDRK